MCAGKATHLNTGAHKKRRIYHQGFTLIELVIVIMLLGIVSIGISGIIRGAMGAVIDVSERQDLIRQGSYLLERFEREISIAVPNSVRINGDASAQCIEFVPMAWNSYYLQIPLAAESSTSIDVLELSDILGNVYSPSSNDYAIVYPSNSQQVYDLNEGHRRLIISCSDDGDGDCSSLDDTDGVVQLNIDNGFATSSPTNSIYFANQSISYCLRNQNVYRHTASINQSQTVYTSGGSLMAQNIVNEMSVDLNTGQQNPFRRVAASAYRNASTQALFIFGREDERISFFKEVHVANVP